MKVVYWLLWILLLSIWALLVGGIDRKIVARLQGRYGPPFWQNITDFVKLFYKKGKVASRSALMVVDAALVMGIVAAVLALSVLPFPMAGGYFQLLSTNGDLIIFAYAFALMAMVYVLIGFGGKSPYTLVGASREISMLLSYEVPFILLIVALGYRAVFVTGLPVESIFSMSALLVAKSQLGTLLMDPIFLGTFLVLLVLGPAIVGSVPFDIPEAETEIVDGYGAELHGPRLAVLFGLKHMKLIAYSYFLWMVFVSPASGNVFVNLLSTLFGTLLVAIIINTIPRAVSGRFRIDQGAKFYLLGPGLASLLLLLLTLV
ncbi:hydrogenase-4 subunit C [Coprothermobacter proteolyticus DSM 5265]|uniref:Hydrogenase-4 component C n=1 Tax=Coprothermobacter proteolyticus (strain ATCC 35245 / DSM 5265 / OCM 4 / BT) TaxID=309798 RepID=B5Y905_COPPD|nr:complex I subunit 1 family protein [Coprothermobacter proteolyticus]ACI18213.1 hydrogenase-4 subunit C [Coprothermobacter proteolyticus DSM 5265]